jgi:hypothetical protein
MGKTTRWTMVTAGLLAAMLLTGCGFVNIGPIPVPTPTPEVPVDPPVNPPVDPPVDPPVNPPVDPPPAASACFKALAPGAEVYMRNKAYALPGRCDSTPWVRDPELCLAIHGVAVKECHLEGAPNRAACEIEILAGCPIWEWRNKVHPAPQPCVQVNDDVTGMSCDHFGSPGTIDDPQTPGVFEGAPAACAAQVDSEGHYMAGFFVIAHGDGEVRACKPDHTGCGLWLRVNH